jgi:hypothetical protein
MFRDSIQQRQAQALATERANREQREREEAAYFERQKQANAATRKAYLDGLAAKRDAEREEREAKVDAQLEPEKTRARNEWLANHLGKSQSDFEQVWTAHLRANAVQDLERQAGEATKQTLRATGEYSF